MQINNHEFLMNRRFFAGAGAFLIGGWKQQIIAEVDSIKKKGLSCILLFLKGGPSQLETFDPKPNTKNGGETKSISTSVPGIQIANGWEKTAEVMKHISVIRSFTNNVADHSRAQFQMHTGYLPVGGEKYPTFGSIVSKEFPAPEQDLPSFVSIGVPGNTIGPGFLGMGYAPLVVHDAAKLPRNVSMPLSVPKEGGQAVKLPEGFRTQAFESISGQRFENRISLLSDLEEEFSLLGAGLRVKDHKAIYANAAKLIKSSGLKCFDIRQESMQVREKYGNTAFGKGCLLARRLVEHGVPFVEVESDGWDTHAEHFKKIKDLNNSTDMAFSALIGDLHQRGLLAKTLVILMGEFGRTPLINPKSGRDHFPKAFSIAIAGAGIKGGYVLGSTSNDGMAVKNDPVTVKDFFATMCHALKIEAAKENHTQLNRPIKIVDGGKIVRKLFL